MLRLAPRSTLFPYTTLFRSQMRAHPGPVDRVAQRRRRRELNRGGGPAHDHDLTHLDRSEEHTSELQSHVNLVCRLLLEKKKKTYHQLPATYCCHLLSRAAIV